jgi:predicted ATP-binding protein involved in virulence
MAAVMEFEVKGLFGLFNHRIPIGSSGLTIVHGPNGSGKTMILRIIHFLFDGDYEGLRTLPFDSAIVTLSDGRQVVAERSEVRAVAVQNRKPRDGVLWDLTLSGVTAEGKPLQAWVVPRVDPRRTRRHAYESASFIEVMLPNLQRLSTAEWFDELSAETLTALDVLRKYGEDLPSETVEYLRTQARPGWLDDFEGSVSTRFISSERLIQITPSTEPEYRREAPRIEPTVSVYAKKLAAEIKARLTDLSRNSAELDRTFPDRVFTRWSESEKDQTKYIRLSALESRLNSMQKARQALVRAGMAPPGELIDVSNVPNTKYAKRMLVVYLEDMERKNAVVKRTADRVNLFLDLVNARLMLKEIQLDEQDGFMVRTASGSLIAPDKLSSGEQHEIVITYELLFEVPEGALVLIDEPELSLHVHWQLQFLQDIARIRKVAPFSLLVATHSPQIVNDEWDKTVRLERPPEGELADG